MNNKTPAKDASYAPAKFDDDYYVAYISYEVVKNEKIDAYSSILARLVAKDAKVSGTSAPATGNDYYTVTVDIEGTDDTADDITIRVYYSPDLHDTCVIFLAGAQTNQQN